MKNYLIILLLGTTLTSCVSGKYLTDDLIAQNGTKTFAANYNDVWDAVQGVLKTDGYDIAFEKKDKGILNTGQKLIKAVAHGSNGSAQAAAIYRQYLVTFKSISENKTQVILTPRIFRGNSDISKAKVWVIDGKYGEISLWQKFFKDIEAFL